jgi:hypothetical protein
MRLPPEQQPTQLKHVQTTFFIQTFLLSFRNEFPTFSPRKNKISVSTGPVGAQFSRPRSMPVGVECRGTKNEKYFLLRKYLFTLDTFDCGGREENEQLIVPLT